MGLFLGFLGFLGFFVFLQGIGGGTTEDVAERQSMFYSIVVHGGLCIGGTTTGDNGAQSGAGHRVGATGQPWGTLSSFRLSLDLRHVQNATIVAFVTGVTKTSPQLTTSSAMAFVLAPRAHFGLAHRALKPRVAVAPSHVAQPLATALQRVVDGFGALNALATIFSGKAQITKTFPMAAHATVVAIVRAPQRHDFVAAGATKTRVTETFVKQTQPKFTVGPAAVGTTAIVWASVRLCPRVVSPGTINAQPPGSAHAFPFETDPVHGTTIGAGVRNAQRSPARHLFLRQQFRTIQATPRRRTKTMAVFARAVAGTPRFATHDVRTGRPTPPWVADAAPVVANTVLAAVRGASRHVVQSAAILPNVPRFTKTFPHLAFTVARTRQGSVGRGTNVRPQFHGRAIQPPKPRFTDTHAVDAEPPVLALRGARARFTFFTVLGRKTWVAKTSSIETNTVAVAVVVAFQCNGTILATEPGVATARTFAGTETTATAQHARFTHFAHGAGRGQKFVAMLIAPHRVAKTFPVIARPMVAAIGAATGGHLVAHGFGVLEVLLHLGFPGVGRCRHFKHNGVRHRFARRARKPRLALARTSNAHAPCGTTSWTHGGRAAIVAQPQRVAVATAMHAFPVPGTTQRATLGLFARFSVVTGHTKTSPVHASAVVVASVVGASIHRTIFPGKTRMAFTLPTGTFPVVAAFVFTFVRQCTPHTTKTRFAIAHTGSGKAGKTNAVPAALMNAFGFTGRSRKTHVAGTESLLAVAFATAAALFVLAAMGLVLAGRAGQVLARRARERRITFAQPIKRGYRQTIFVFPTPTMVTAVVVAGQFRGTVLSGVVDATRARAGVRRVARPVPTAIVQTGTQLTKFTEKTLVAAALCRDATAMPVTGFDRWHVDGATAVDGTGGATVPLLAHALVHPVADFGTRALQRVGAIVGARRDLNTAGRSGESRIALASAVHVVATATATALLWFTRADHQRTVVALVALPARACFGAHAVVECFAFAVAAGTIVWATGTCFGAGPNLLGTIGPVETLVADTSPVQANALAGTVVQAFRRGHRFHVDHVAGIARPTGIAHAFSVVERTSMGTVVLPTDTLQFQHPRRGRLAHVARVGLQPTKHHHGIGGGPGKSIVSFGTGRKNVRTVLGFQINFFPSVGRNVVAP